MAINRIRADIDLDAILYNMESMHNKLKPGTMMAAVVKADITALGIPGTNTTYGVATQSANGLMSAADKTKLDGMPVSGVYGEEF